MSEYHARHGCRPPSPTLPFLACWETSSFVQGGHVPSTPPIPAGSLLESGSPSMPRSWGRSCDFDLPRTQGKGLPAFRKALPTQPFHLLSLIWQSFCGHFAKSSSARPACREEQEVPQEWSPACLVGFLAQPGAPSPDPSHGAGRNVGAAAACWLAPFYLTLLGAAQRTPTHCSQPAFPFLP